MKKTAYILLVMGFVLIKTAFAGDIVTLDKGFYVIKYSKKHKGAIEVNYTLSRDLINSGNIEERPRFYTDRELKRRHRTHYSDYTGTGFDRGHLANDASFDYSEKSLKSTYTMANIVPQYPNVNRLAWLSVENMERYAAQQFETLRVRNIVLYRDNTVLKKLPIHEALKNKTFESNKEKANYVKAINRSKSYLDEKRISVPSGFIKVLSNKNQNYKECFYVPNKSDMVSEDFNTYLVNCEKLGI